MPETLVPVAACVCSRRVIGSRLGVASCLLAGNSQIFLLWYVVNTYCTHADTDKISCHKRVERKERERMAALMQAGYKQKSYSSGETARFRRFRNLRGNRFAAIFPMACTCRWLALGIVLESVALAGGHAAALLDHGSECIAPRQRCCGLPLLRLYGGGDQTWQQQQQMMQQPCAGQDQKIPTYGSRCASQYPAAFTCLQLRGGAARYGPSRPADTHEIEEDDSVQQSNDIGDDNDEADAVYNERPNERARDGNTAQRSTRGNRLGSRPGRDGGGGGGGGKPVLDK